MRIHQRYVPEAFLAPEAQAGFLTSLDRLAAHLGRLRRIAPDRTRTPIERRRTAMPSDATTSARRATCPAAIADEYLALADLLEAAGPPVWDAPSLCEGWRTREVVAHVTMPARYDGPGLHGGAGGRGRRLHPPVEHGGGARRRAARARLLADLRSEVLHGWQPPGGGMDGALTHCVIHGLDIVEAVPLADRVPDDRILRVLSLVAGPGGPNLFGTDLSGRGAARRRPRVVLRVRRARRRAGPGAGAGGLRAPAAGGATARRGGRHASRSAERLRQLARQKAHRAVAAGLLDRDRPIGQAGRAGRGAPAGKRALRARTSQTVRAMPRLTSWRPVHRVVHAGGTRGSTTTRPSGP